MQMPNLEVEFLAAALDDLGNILDYISIDYGAPRTALQFLESVEARCVEIGTWPLAGRARSDLGSGIRTVPFRSLVIVYRVFDSKVEIVRVFGQRQDYVHLMQK